MMLPWSPRWRDSRRWLPGTGQPGLGHWSGPGRRTPRRHEPGHLLPRLPAALDCGHGAGTALRGTAGHAGVLGAAPQYAAVAYLKVEANPQPVVFRRSEFGGARDLYEIYRGTQVQLIKSPYVVGAALAEPAIAALPGVRRNEPDSVGWLCNDLSVSFPQKEGEIMCVTLVGNDKEEITTLVNAVVDTYLNKVVVHEQEDKIGRVDKLGNPSRRQGNRGADRAEQPQAPGRRDRRRRGQGSPLDQAAGGRAAVRGIEPGTGAGAVRI